MRLINASLDEYLTRDWGDVFKPNLKRAVLEMDSIWAMHEANREGIPYTPLYWNKISEGKWLYSLWEIE